MMILDHVLKRALLSRTFLPGPASLEPASSGLKVMLFGGTEGQCVCETWGRPSPQEQLQPPKVELCFSHKI